MRASDPGNQKSASSLHDLNSGNCAIEFVPFSFPFLLVTVWIIFLTACKKVILCPSFCKILQNSWINHDPEKVNAK